MNKTAVNRAGVPALYSSVSQPFLSCVPPEPICHTMSTPMLMILKKYNVTQVIIKCFQYPLQCACVPLGVRVPPVGNHCSTEPQLFSHQSSSNCV